MEIKLKTLLMDRCFTQTFEEVNLQEEFLSACQKMNIEPVITSPTGIKEHSVDTISDNLNFGSGTLKTINASGLGTYTKGEDEAIAVAKTIENTWIGTFDKGAIKKCKRSGIKYIDHITFLLAMTEIGVIDKNKRDSVYKNWGTNIFPQYQTLEDYLTSNKKEIKSKIKILKS